MLLPTSPPPPSDVCSCKSNAAAFPDRHESPVPPKRQGPPTDPDRDGGPKTCDPHPAYGSRAFDSKPPVSVFNSSMPAAMVVRDKPVALETQLTPPQASSRASLAAQCRQVNASIKGVKTHGTCARIPSTTGCIHTAVVTKSQPLAQAQFDHFIFAQALTIGKLIV